MGTSWPDVIPKLLPKSCCIKNHHKRVCWNMIILQKQPLGDILQNLGVLKNFTIFTGKQLCWSLFLIKLKASFFIKKRLQHRCLPVNIAKFLRTFFFPKHLWWLLLLLGSCKTSVMGVFAKIINYFCKNAKYTSDFSSFGLI